MNKFHIPHPPRPTDQDRSDFASILITSFIAVIIVLGLFAAL